MITYDIIKQLAQQQGSSVNDLLALAPKNDPFYTGRPADIQAAYWFKGVWDRFNLSSGIHLRGIHYLAQAPGDIQLPVTLSWVEKETKQKYTTDVYINTDRCWEYLTEAAKYARYLGLVDPDALIDNKHPDPLVYARFYDPTPGDYNDPTPRYIVEGLDQSAVERLQIPGLPALPALPEINEFPGLPDFYVNGYSYIQQGYLLEVWAEKSAVRRDLEDLCRRYGANLIIGQGELSITAVTGLLRHRMAQANKPARIFYISDFDPAGLGMPISIARKIEFFARSGKYGDELDIELHPIVLTEEQVYQYQLPRVPNDAGDKRVSNFERDHGEGRVELDALMALHPGELARIVEQAFQRYYDSELESRAYAIRRQAWTYLRQQRNELLSPEIREKWTQAQRRYRELREDYLSVQQEFELFVASYQSRLDELKPEMTEIVAELTKAHEAASSELDQLDLDIEEEYPLPEPETSPIDEPLYQAGRTYFDQLHHFKAYRHGTNNGYG